MHEIFYVNHCLQLIEARLNWGSRDAWVYEDFKKLQHLIFEASGISLSVHTLERLFGKLKTHKNYNPQTDTKNALAIFLGYPSWAHFRDSHPVLPAAAAAQPADRDAGPQLADTSPAVKPGRRSIRALALLSVLLLVVIAALFFFYRPGWPGAGTPAAIQFKATNIFGQGPHTVKFNYRIPKDFTEAVYVDFGNGAPHWPLDKNGKHFFKTYMFPGIYPVRLQAGEATLARASIFIESEDWRGYLYNTYEDKETRTPLADSVLFSPGRLYTDPRLLGQDLKGSRYFLEYTYIRDFKASGDNFSFDTRFRSKQENGGVLCNDIWFKLIGTRGELKMHFLAPGCSSFVQLLFGEQKLNGHARDLSAFARDISDWKQVRLEVRNKKVAIYFEGQLIFKTTYKQPIGNIMGISITSKGAAETDLVRLYNNREELVFADDFE